MSRGKKTSEADREKLRSVIYMNPTESKLDWSRQSGIPEATVHELLKDEHFLDKDKFEEVRAIKKREFIDAAWEFIKKSLKAATIKVDDLLEHPEKLDKTRITELSLSVAQIYDKQALACNEPTMISESKQPTPEMVSELENNLAKLKQLIGKKTG
jgi:hypothetical protein